jgi:hypothetical protein
LVQSVRQECLDLFVVFGERYLHYLLGENQTYYSGERPHQGLGNVSPSGTGPPGSVVCEERLGGLLRHYRRAA